jgi:hypothetical protein
MYLKVFIAAQCAWAYGADRFRTRPSFFACTKAFRRNCPVSVRECGAALEEYFENSWRDPSIGLPCVRRRLLDEPLRSRRCVPLPNVNLTRPERLIDRRGRFIDEQIMLSTYSITEESNLVL